MKALMILGAIIGFLIGGGPALTGQTSWPPAIWHACAAAVVAALLARWWGRIWMAGLQDAMQQRLHPQTPSTPTTSVKPAAKA
jgi:hypothetical protein